MIRGKLDEPISGCLNYIKNKEKVLLRHLYFPAQYDGEVGCTGNKNMIGDEYQSNITYKALIVIEGVCEDPKDPCFRPSYPFDKL